MIQKILESISDVYRKCASIISEAWYRVVLFIPLNWAGCEMEIYSTDDVEKYCGNESAICVANHRNGFRINYNNIYV